MLVGKSDLTDMTNKGSAGSSLNSPMHRAFRVDAQ